MTENVLCEYDYNYDFSSSEQVSWSPISSVGDSYWES